MPNQLVTNPFQSEAQRAWMYANNPAMAKRWAKHTPKSRRLPASKHPVTNGRIARLDPSRTITLRRQWQADLARRFTNLRQAIVQLILHDDALGLKQRSVFNYDPNEPRDDQGQWTEGGVSGLKVYHGGLGEEGRHTTYYTTDKGIAQSYVDMYNDRFGSGGALHEKIISIHNPAPESVVVAEAKKLGMDVREDAYTPASVFDNNLYEDKDVGKLVSTLRNKGYDGTTLMDIPYGQGTPQDVHIVFTQPKTPSALAGSQISPLKTFGLDQKAGIAKYKDEEGVIHDVHRMTTGFGKHVKSMWIIKNSTTNAESEPGNWITVRGQHVFISDGAEGRWQFHSTEQKLAAFREWLKRQIILHVVGEHLDEDAWWNRYVMDGFKRGAARAFDDTRPQVREWMDSPEAKQRLDFYNGTREEFLRSSFNWPVSREKVKLLASRTFTDLKGVTDSMAARISHSLVDGLTKGDNPRVIARDLAKAVDVGKVRAQTIARTECLPGGTLVSAAVVRAVFRRWYSGPMVEIKTGSGRILSATPNHPMLTQNGWTAVGLLQQGDYLVRDTREQYTCASGDANIDRGPSTLREIYDSLSAVRTLERDHCVSGDFHGDGMNSNVDILRPDRELAVGRFSPIYNPLVQLYLAGADETTAPICHICGRLLSINKQECLCESSQGNPSSNQSITNNISADSQIISNSTQGLSTLVSTHDVRNVQPLNELIPNSSPLPGVGLPISVGPADTSSPKNKSDRLLITPDLSSDLPLGESSQIELDDVILVTIRHFDGHVYNLETPFGYYNANSYYTGNTIRTHAEGQLDAFERMGVTHVGVMAEWLTAGDSRVCPQCRPLDGVVLKVTEATGLLPRHPNCRCCWMPANVGEDESDQKRGKSGIGEAFDESYEAELPKTVDRSLEQQKRLSSWGGADKDISKARPASVLNKQSEKGSWVTIRGSHVLIKDGEITKGPKRILGKKLGKKPQHTPPVSQPQEPVDTSGSVDDAMLDSIKTDLSGLPEDVQTSVNDYALGGSYTEVNGLLRGLRPDIVGGYKQIIERDIKNLRMAFDAAAKPTTKDMTVYRGIGNTSLSMEVGSEFTDQGFLSTSTDEGFAKEFVGGYGGKDKTGFLLRVRVPKGEKILVPLGSSNRKKEIVLRDSTKYKVISRSGNVVDLEMIGNVRPNRVR